MGIFQHLIDQSANKINNRIGKIGLSQYGIAQYTLSHFELV